jgi:hypothetical protein
MRRACTTINTACLCDNTALGKPSASFKKEEEEGTCDSSFIFYQSNNLQKEESPHFWQNPYGFIYQNFPASMAEVL